MQIYIIVERIEKEICDILGVFTEYKQAKLHWDGYMAEHPCTECWIETHDADIWLHEAQKEYKIIHKTMVNKTSGMMSHTVSVSAEALSGFPVEEGQGWYIIRQVLDTFDEEEGRKKNLQQLQDYIQKKGV